MKAALVLLALFVLAPASLSTEDKPNWNGYWWASMTPDFRMGWVTGYAKAMDLAGSLSMATCAANMPLYQQRYPDTDPKVLLQKLCLSDTQLDYDGISLGQFVDGMDTFYKDYRNKQLEVGWAIEYVRDAIKGKPAQELDAEVAMWRRCSAAVQTGDKDQIAKACNPSASSQ